MSALPNGDQPAWKRSASTKRPSPLAGEDMFHPADIHIHSTPESRGSNVNPRSGDRGLSPNTLLRITDDPVSDQGGRQS